MQTRSRPLEQVRGHRFEWVLWAITLLLAGPVGAQTYPLRPISIIVSTTPGTGIDTLARAIGQKLIERWNIGVAVENRPGAAGNVASEVVARASPDGHTLLMAPTSFLTNTALNHNLSFDPLKSFTPLSLLATGTLALVISNDTPALSVKELVSLAKSKPGILNYASAGNGSIQHLAFELFKQEAGIDLVHVPYKSNGPAYVDLVPGRVSAMITTINTSVPYIQGGKMKLLAVLSEERSAIHPSAPTFKEAGYPGLNVSTWNALLAPAGLPPEIVRKLNNEVNAILALADVNELLAKQGLNPVGGPPSRLEELLKSEAVRWQRVVTKAGIKPD